MRGHPDVPRQRLSRNEHAVKLTSRQRNLFELEGVTSLSTQLDLTKGLIDESFNQSGFNPFITLLSFQGLRPCGKPIPVKAFHPYLCSP